LFEYFNAKDDTAFWHAWRKKNCLSSLKTTSTLNGKQGDANICTEFTEQFRSVFKTNTVDSDCVYEAEFLKMDFANEKINSPRIDIDLCRQCVGKMKLNKSPGFDNVSTEHLLYGGDELCVHLCLLFNTMLQHCYVPERFGYGLIVLLLKDKHGDQSRSDMYRGITLSPTIAKLFEYILMELYGDQLLSDTLQFGFKKHSGCCHALFTFKETTKYFIKNGSKVYCAFVDASKAFDKVLHNGLFIKLIKKNVSPRFIHILKNWYSNSMLQ